MLFGNAEIYTRDAKSLLTKASGFINAYDFTLNPYQAIESKQKLTRRILLDFGQNIASQTPEARTPDL